MRPNFEALFLGLYSLFLASVLIKAYTGFALSNLHIRLETATSSPGPELGHGLVVHHPDMAPSGHKQLCSVIKIATNKKIIYWPVRGTLQLQLS